MSDASPTRSPESQWFWDHYDEAAGQIIDVFAAEGISLTDRLVADVGCGDGIMDLGVLHKAKPRTLVGFDLNPTDVEYLQRQARQEGVAESDWTGLRFKRSEVNRLPAEDGAFDFAFSWSAFEHISQPIEVLREIRRILSPGGRSFCSSGRSISPPRDRIFGSGSPRITTICSAQSRRSSRSLSAVT